MADGEELIDYGPDKDRKYDSFNDRCHYEMETVTEYMKFYRNKAGLTQKQLAEKLGISVSYLNKIENNNCKVPAYVVYLYCQTLNVSMDEMFSLINTESSKETIRKIRHELPHLPQELLDTIWSMIEIFQNKDDIVAKAKEDIKKKAARKAKREQNKPQEK